MAATKPTFEDVLEQHLGSMRQAIWHGNNVQTFELRRQLANAIGTLVRDAYRSWFNRIEALKSVDNVPETVLLQEPAHPLEGVDLSPNPDPNQVEENTAQSDTVQHGPVVDAQGNLVNPEMRTISQPDLEAAKNPEDNRPEVEKLTTASSSPTEPPTTMDPNSITDPSKSETPDPVVINQVQSEPGSTPVNTEGTEGSNASSTTDKGKSTK